MAHFAELDGNGVVIRVIVVDNKDTANKQGNEEEQIGIDYLTELYGHDNWKQTSYNSYAGKHARQKTPLRKNFAGKGYKYDGAKNAFIPPRPHASWKVKDSTGLWEPPKAYPKDGNDYEWDEDSLSWIKL